MGWAALLLGRDQEAIEYLEQSLAITPEGIRIEVKQHTYRRLAAAYAFAGQPAHARQALGGATGSGPLIPCAITGRTIRSVRFWRRR